MSHRVTAAVEPTDGRPECRRRSGSVDSGRTAVDRCGSEPGARPGPGAGRPGDAAEG